MTDQMNLAEVPEDLVQVAARAMAARESAEGQAFAPDGWWTDDARTALAAALPIHERKVRARIGADLRAVMFPCSNHGGALAGFDSRCISCQRYAALVGAERVIAGRESPSAKAVRETRTGSGGDGGRG